MDVIQMAKMCPKCSADTEPLEEESQQFCIHEKLLMAAGGAVALVAVVLYGGIV